MTQRSNGERKMLANVMCHLWGSSVVAVGLALRAVNEVKARLGPVTTWMGDTADCFNWTLVVS